MVCVCCHGVGRRVLLSKRIASLRGVCTALSIDDLFASRSAKIISFRLDLKVGTTLFARRRPLGADELCATHHTGRDAVDGFNMITNRINRNSRNAEWIATWWRPGSVSRDYFSSAAMWGWCGALFPPSSTVEDLISPRYCRVRRSARAGAVTGTTVHASRPLAGRQMN